jgi:capsular exopolysaccharide synthesis family protein
MIALAREVEVTAVGTETVSNRLTLALSPSLVVSANPLDGPAEAIRALRTHLMAQHFQEGRRALAICAASRGVGCSFIAANLALALAQIGVKVLLIDADLRTPKQTSLFGVKSRLRGLAECLASKDVTLRDYIQTDVQPSLSVMFSGAAPENPQELLAGDGFRTLSEFCLREFDATIVDTPPANTCADARRVSTVMGYSLIVARRNVTYVDDVKTLAAQLTADHSRVVGTVLNEA